MNTQIKDLKAPYMTSGNRVVGMMAWSLVANMVLVSLYSINYDHSFIKKYFVVLSLGFGLEVAYHALVDGQLKLRSGSSVLTSAILMSSIPTTMPMRSIFFALVVGIVIAKLPISARGLHLNPALVARLFLMMAYHEDILKWTRPGVDMDAISTATPIDFFHQEGIKVGLHNLLAGHIFGNYEEMLEIVPGGPGEAYTPVIMLLGLLLWRKGILDPRLGIGFVISFAISCHIFKQPVLFNVFSGAVIFSAVFIGGDPRTTPTTKAGRYAAGIFAGMFNAFIRSFTQNSEGIVYTFLTINLLSPFIDRVCFFGRGIFLKLRQKWWRRKVSMARSNATAKPTVSNLEAASPKTESLAKKSVV